MIIAKNLAVVNLMPYNTDNSLAYADNSLFQGLRVQKDSVRAVLNIYDSSRLLEHSFGRKKSFELNLLKDYTISDKKFSVFSQYYGNHALFVSKEIFSNINSDLSLAVLNTFC